MTNLDFSAFAEAPAAAKGKKSTRPVLVLKDEEKAIVDQLVLAKEEVKKAEGVVKTNTAMLRGKALDLWLSHNRDSEFETSVEIGGKDKSILMIFSKGYRSGADPASVVKAITGKLPDDKEKAEAVEAAAKAKAEEFFKAKFSLVIDGDAIPEAARQAVIAGIAKVFTENGINPAKAVTAKSLFIPKDTFNERRAVEFTTEQNLRLDGVLATPTAVKTV